MVVLFGLLSLAIILWFLNGFVKANPKGLAKGLRMGGGLALVGFAGFLGLRGEIFIALPLAAAGFGIIGYTPSFLAGWMPAGFGARTQKAMGQRSRVRSAFLEMELDHDTGAMTGRVLAGRYQGVTLDSLDLPALMAMLNEIDDESRALLVAYLERRHPGWREHADGGAATGKVETPGSGKMTAEEAQQILGVAPGASPQDISRAHRLLMMKLHPDLGGSTYLAARVNEAKDVLLGRHR